jgi:hypothetical protein
MRRWTDDKLQILRDNIHLSDEQLATLTGSTMWGVNQARLRYRILRPKKVLQEKTCPLCKETKPLDGFDTYYSKERNKVRQQNYCKDCSPAEKTKRSKDYYNRKGEKVRAYQKKYRSQNKALIAPKRAAFRKKYTRELKDCYVAYSLAKKAGVKSKDVREVPGLIEAERLRLQLVRTLKNKRNEKQNGGSEKPSVPSPRKAQR